ncbi:MAG: DUF192 domain-containing protein [Bacillota bacterium]|jgi:uncharacterized membrane protein (UPF0127 family)
MIINPNSNGYCLVRELQPAATFWQRWRGLMGRASLPEGSGLLISPCRSVHTMHMRFPIDVIFLDRAWTVVGLEPSLRPWRFSRNYPSAWFAIELPAGTIQASGTEIGHRLQCAAD